MLITKMARLLGRGFLLLLTLSLILGSKGTYAKQQAASNSQLPQIHFLYDVNLSSNDIWGYQIDNTTGSLTPIAGSPFSTVASPYNLTLDSQSEFAYLTSSGSTISIYSIDPATGFLGLVDSFSLPPISSVVLTRHDKFAYLAGAQSGGVIAVYAVDKSDGLLSPTDQPPVPVEGGGAGTGAVTPCGEFFYVPNPIANSVSAYAINKGKGTLTPVPGSPFVAGTNPTGLTVEPRGRFLYVTNINGDNVSAYVIDHETGSLFPVTGSPFPAGSRPAGIAVDPLGRFAFVANSNSDNVSVYAIDSSTGSLTPVNGSPFQSGRGSFSVAVDPLGKFVYTADLDVLPSGISTVSGFALDQNTGALTQVPGSPYSVGTNADFIAITGQWPVCSQ